VLQQIRKLLGKTPKAAEASAPLLGTPAVRRVKTYAADTGYTWSYTFEGYRLEEPPADGRSYVFSVWSGNRPAVAISMVVGAAVIAAMEQQAGREVDARELYALAKMHFFAVLDAVEQTETGARYVLSEAEAIEIWERLEL
jgi:hypothetical protein